MPDVYANLDALIPREDFEATEVKPSGSNIGSTQAITELEKGRFFYSVLKKPDFQRETANWTPEKVAELVNSFVADDLVPSIRSLGLEIGGAGAEYSSLPCSPYPLLPYRPSSLSMPFSVGLGAALTRDIPVMV